MLKNSRSCLRIRPHSASLLAVLLSVAVAACASPENSSWRAEHAELQAQSDDADWVLHCGLGEQSFELRFDSPSGDVLEDDMRVSLRRPEQRVQPVDLPPAWYMPVHLEGAPQSVCHGSEALDLGEGRVLVLLAHSRRPGLDGLSAVVVDAVAGEVLSTEPLLGEVEEHSRLEQRDGRLVLELVTAYGGDAETPERALTTWHALSLEQGRLSLKALPAARD
jgi:hypothetical protein